MEHIEITIDKPYTVPKGKCVYIGDEQIAKEGDILELIFSPTEGIGLQIMGFRADSEPQITIGVGEIEIPEDAIEVHCNLS